MHIQVPLFSVVIPAYNRAEFLPQVLETVLAQTYTNFELLLIDDGSTDNTPQLMQQWMQRDSRIRYYRKANEERSIARNTGFALAKGKYVVFHDSDDWMLPHHLATLAHAIAQNPDVCFFTTKFVLQTETGILESEINHLPAGRYDYRLFLSGNPVGIFVCVKKECPDIHLFPPQFNFCEDWIFHLLNYQHRALLLIDEVTNIVVVHKNRSMTKHSNVIAGRIAATQFILNQISLSSQEQTILWGNTYRFCAIHSYLAGYYSSSIRYILLAIRKLGISASQVALLCKILLSRRVVLWLKRLWLGSKPTQE
ncbi:MAG: glycosyltransferase family 2 protein [Cytophagales bacterium]|nr:glycosyltransferase [Bernardetiaceae bacterium]MDW8205314.1 glycosyltransferase family 2 protein [Cytophagales bacterium]